MKTVSPQSDTVTSDRSPNVCVVSRRKVCLQVAIYRKLKRSVHFSLGRAGMEKFLPLIQLWGFLVDEVDTSLPPPTTHPILSYKINISQRSTKQTRSDKMLTKLMLGLADPCIEYMSDVSVG